MMTLHQSKRFGISIIKTTLANAVYCEPVCTKAVREVRFLLEQGCQIFFFKMSQLRFEKEPKEPSPHFTIANISQHKNTLSTIESCKNNIQFLKKSVFNFTYDRQFQVF